MNEKFERFINMLIVTFDNFYKANTGAWFLDKSTLIEFICNKTLKEPIYIGMVNCSAGDFKTRLSRWPVEDKGNGEFKVKLQEYNVNVKLYNNLPEGLILAKGDELETLLKKRDTAMRHTGVWRYNLCDTFWYHLPVPYKTGTFLDLMYPLWFTKIKYDNVESAPNNDIFFTDERSKNAVQLMGLLRECAETAGFGKYIFPAFGTLLGIIRENGFIGSDRDLDHGIAGWKVTEGQEEVFLREVARDRTVIEKIDGKDTPVRYYKGLYTGRCKSPQRRSDNSRFLWTSLGHKKPNSEKGVKSCVWNFFKHENFVWHSKGRKWLADRKFPGILQDYSGNAEAIAKGMPSECIEEFVDMEFRGVKINVPKLSGHCLDAWYPGWMRPRKDKSSKKHLMIVTRWENEKKWKMM